MKKNKKKSVTLEEAFAIQRQANGFMVVLEAIAKGESVEDIDSKYKGAEYRAFHEELMAKNAAYKENFEEYRELNKDETFKEMDSAFTEMAKTISPTALVKAFALAARHPLIFRKATKHQQKAVNIFAENWEMDKPDRPDVPKM